MIGLNNVSKILKRLLNPRNASKMISNRLYALSLSSFSKLIQSSSILLNKKINCNVHNLNYSCKQHTSSTKANDSTSESSDINNNSLTLGKSKKLMRLIYSRVHPDLFTNERIAQVIYLIA